MEKIETIKQEEISEKIKKFNYPGENFVGKNFGPFARITSKKGNVVYGCCRIKIDESEKPDKYFWIITDERDGGFGYSYKDIASIELYNNIDLFLLFKELMGEKHKLLEVIKKTNESSKKILKEYEEKKEKPYEADTVDIVVW